jgi:hypothetical protein
VTALPCKKPAITKTSHDNCHALKINKRIALSIWIILVLLPELTVYNSDGIYSKSTYLLIPWSRVLLEKLTSKFCH